MDEWAKTRCKCTANVQQVSLLSISILHSLDKMKPFALHWTTRDQTQIKHSPTLRMEQSPTQSWKLWPLLLHLILISHLIWYRKWIVYVVKDSGTVVITWLISDREALEQTHFYKRSFSFSLTFHTYTGPTPFPHQSQSQKDGNVGSIYGWTVSRLLCLLFYNDDGPYRYSGQCDVYGVEFWFCGSIPWNTICPTSVRCFPPQKIRKSNLFFFSVSVSDFFFEKRIGDLRFRLPEPIEFYTGHHLATTFGPACIQQTVRLPAFPPQVPEGATEIMRRIVEVFPESEDCEWCFFFLIWYFWCDESDGWMDDISFFFFLLNAPTDVLRVKVWRWMWSCLGIGILGMKSCLLSW